QPAGRLDRSALRSRVRCRCSPLLLLRRARLARHLAAGASRFRKADRDGLLATRHLLAGSPALQGSSLALVHRLLDLLGRFLSISSHDESPADYVGKFSALAEHSSKVVQIRGAIDRGRPDRSNKSRQRSRIDSILRSGTSQISATRTNSPSETHEFTKANGIASAYAASETLPLLSLPTAAASFDVGPSCATIALVSRVYAIPASNSTTP